MTDSAISELLQFISIDDKLVEAISLFKTTNDKSALIQQIVEKTAFDIPTIISATKDMTNKPMIKLYLNLAHMNDDIIKAIDHISLDKITNKYVFFYLHPNVSATDKKTISKNLTSWNRKLDAEKRDKLSIVSDSFTKKVFENIATDIYRGKFELNDATLSTLIEFVVKKRSNMKSNTLDDGKLNSAIISLIRKALEQSKAESNTKLITTVAKMNEVHSFFYNLSPLVSTQADFEEYFHISLLSNQNTKTESLHEATDAQTIGSKVATSISSIISDKPYLSLSKAQLELIFGTDADAFVLWYSTKQTAHRTHTPSRLFESSIRALMLTEWFLNTDIGNAIIKHYYNSLKNDIEALKRLTERNLTRQQIIDGWAGTYNSSDTLYKLLELREFETITPAPNHLSRPKEFKAEYSRAVASQIDFLEIFKLVSSVNVNRLYVSAFTHNNDVRKLFSSFNFFDSPHYSSHHPKRFRFTDFNFETSDAVGFAYNLCENEMYQYVLENNTLAGRENIINRYLELNFIKSVSNKSHIEIPAGPLSDERQSLNDSSVSVYRREAESNISRWVKLASEETLSNLCFVLAINNQSDKGIWNKMFTPEIIQAMKLKLSKPSTLIEYRIVTLKGILSPYSFDAFFRFADADFNFIISTLEYIKTYYSTNITNETTLRDFLSSFADNFLKPTLDLVLSTAPKAKFDTIVNLYLTEQKGRVAFVETVLDTAFSSGYKDFYEYAKNTPFYSATSTDKKRIAKKCEELEAAERIANGVLLDNKKAISKADQLEAKNFLEEFLKKTF